MIIILYCSNNNNNNNNFNWKCRAMVGPKLSRLTRDKDYQGTTVHSRIFMGTWATVSVVYLQELSL